MRTLKSISKAQPPNWKLGKRAGNRNYVTESEKNRIRELAAQGMKYVEIAKIVGRSAATVTEAINALPVGSQFFDVDTYARKITTI